MFSKTIVRPNPKSMSDDAIAKTLAQRGALLQWLKDVEAEGIQRIQEGHMIPGWILSETKQPAVWSNESKARSLLNRLLGGRAMRLVSPFQALKLLKAKRLPEELGRLVERPEGRPVLRKV